MSCTFGGDNDVVDELEDGVGGAQEGDEAVVEGFALLDEVILVQQLLQREGVLVQDRLDGRCLRVACHPPEHPGKHRKQINLAVLAELTTV